VLEEGSSHAIEVALDRDGLAQAALFLEELETGKPWQKDLVAGMAIRLETFAATGELLVPRQLNHLRDELWEFKCGKLRLPFYHRRGAACGQVRITHGFIKRGDRTPVREIDRGLAIMREDLSR